MSIVMSKKHRSKAKEIYEFTAEEHIRSSKIRVAVGLCFYNKVGGVDKTRLKSIISSEHVDKLEDSYIGPEELCDA